MTSKITKTRSPFPEFGLWVTPESFEACFDKYSGSERTVAMVAAGMAWNYSRSFMLANAEEIIPMLQKHLDSEAKVAEIHAMPDGPRKTSV